MSPGSWLGYNLIRQGTVVDYLRVYQQEVGTLSHFVTHIEGTPVTWPTLQD